MKFTGHRPIWLTNLTKDWSENKGVFLSTQQTRHSFGNVPFVCFLLITFQGHVQCYLCLPFNRFFMTFIWKQCLNNVNLFITQDRSNQLHNNDDVLVRLGGDVQRLHWTKFARYIKTKKIRASTSMVFSFLKSAFCNQWASLIWISLLVFTTSPPRLIQFIGCNVCLLYDCLSVCPLLETPLPGGLENSGWRAYR